MTRILVRIVEPIHFLIKLVSIAIKIINYMIYITYEYFVSKSSVKVDKMKIKRKMRINIENSTGVNINIARAKSPRIRPKYRTTTRTFKLKTKRRELLNIYQTHLLTDMV